MKRSLLVLALALSACGSATPWVPAPSSQVPVEPRPDERHALGSPASAAASGSAAAAAPSAPEPMSGALPQDLDAKLVTHAVCKDKQCLVAGLYPAGAAADGGAPAAIWSHDLPEKGTTLTFPRHSGVDLYGVVLSGKVRIQPLEAASKTTDLTRWGAFRAPGAGVSVIAQEAGARVVLAIAGESVPIAETAAQLKDRKTLKKVSWNTRPEAVETLSLDAATDLAWGKGSAHARIGFDHGRASFGILMASRDAPVLPHSHDTSWEILAPLSADGVAKRASAAGSTDMTEIPVGDGTVVAIPKGTQHAWLPSGKKPLIAVQMYLLPGPEQRFKKLSESAPK